MAVNEPSAGDIPFTSEKIINSRIALKIDTASNWTAKNTLLKKGELAFVTFDNSSEIRFKVGDGTKTFTQLPYQDEPIKGLISKATSQAQSIILYPSNWATSGSQFKYNYDKSFSFLNATIPPIIVCTENTAEYNYITSAEIADGTFILTANKKPSNQITLTIVEVH